MARSNARLEAARNAYREALEAARANPTPEAWTRLLAAGKDLSAAHEPRNTSRRSRRGTAPREPAGSLSEGSLNLDPSTFD
jgi:hypothetical protein